MIHLLTILLAAVVLPAVAPQAARDDPALAAACRQRLGEIGRAILACEGLWMHPACGRIGDGRPPRLIGPIDPIGLIGPAKGGLSADRTRRPADEAASAVALSFAPPP